MEKPKVHLKIRHREGHMKILDEFLGRRHRAAEFHCMVREEAVNYHFQPIFSAKTGKVYAYEALMRVDLPYFRSPDMVVEFAKGKNRLKDVEKLTFFKATETYKELLQQGKLEKAAYVFINSIGNVCLDKVDSDRYYETYKDIKDNVVVEITETEDIEIDSLNIKRKSKGFSGMFALDDYGSGCNMAKALIVLKPHFIKIDMTLIQGIDKSLDKQHIVSNVISYAHRRDMKVVAEGIETAGELTTSLGLGADLLQGYFLARPAEIPGDINPAALDIINRSHYTQTALLS
jgi:EAL domain-containing protein (putative c-di-GMP-specific phosphodiesterase class I)